MNEQSGLSIVQYYKRLSILLKTLGALFTASPILSALLPESSVTYAYPPLGGIDLWGRTGTVVFAAIATLIVYYATPQKSVFRKLLGMALLSLVTFAAYLALFSLYVKRVEIPTEKKAVLVSIGTERTKYAIENFPGESDLDLLLQRGFTDEEISKLWTPQSILKSRLSLWLSFTLFLSFVAATLSIGAFAAKDFGERAGKA
jgi:hypothetical protein